MPVDKIAKIIYNSTKGVTPMTRIATFYDHIRDIADEEHISRVDAMLQAKDLGISALEISQNNIFGRERELLHELQTAGMGITTIPSYFHFNEDDDVTAQAQPTLEAAQFLGAKNLLVIPGFVSDDADALTREHAAARMIDNINRLAALADRYGVSLLMESYDNPGAVFTRIAEVKRFVTECEGLSACFDTGNFRLHCEDELVALHELRPHIKHVHLKDRLFTPTYGSHGPATDDGKQLFPCPTGSGELKIAEIIDELERTDYTGTYVIEHYGAQPMLQTLRQSAAFVQSRIFSKA